LKKKEICYIKEQEKSALQVQKEQGKEEK